MSRLLGLLCGTAILLTAFAASADSKGQAVRSAEIYSSPGRYPILGRLERGDSVSIENCTKDNAWCAIDVGDIHGWVLASMVEVIARKHR